MRKILCIVLVLALCGCHGTSSPEDGGEKLTGDFTLAMRTPESLDPLRATEETAALVFDLVYDSLVYVDREMRPVPYLAESCTISEDGMTISFALHDGILWHDGAAFTAADVEHTIGRIRSLGEDSMYYDRISYIEAVTVSDLLHFSVKLTKPHVTVLNLLDFPIVPCHRGDLDTTMVGTGQYKLEAYTPNKNMTLLKNEGWALSDPPAMERIYVKMVQRAEDATSLVKIGEVTAVAANMRTIGGLGIGENMKITHYPTLEYEFVGFNMENRHLVSDKVRHAISLALDRAKIIEDVFLGYGSAATVPVPPTSYLYVGEADKTARNIEEARANLFAEGYVIEEGKARKMLAEAEEITLSLSLLVNEENEERKKAAECIRRDLSEIGISIDIVTLPFSEYLTRLSEGAFDMYVGGCRFSADLDFSFLLGAAAPIQNGYSSEELDAAMRLIDPQKTDETIRAAYIAFQEVFLRDMPITGLCFLDGALVHSASLCGIENPAASKLYRNIGKWYLA